MWRSFDARTNWITLDGRGGSFVSVETAGSAALATTDLAVVVGSGVLEGSFAGTVFLSVLGAPWLLLNLAGSRLIVDTWRERGLYNHLIVHKDGTN